MKKIVFFILFIFKITFSSQEEHTYEIRRDDIVRKHLSVFIGKHLSVTSQQLQEICSRAYSFDEKQKESFILESDVYFLQQELKEKNCFDSSGNNPVIKNYLAQLRSNRSEVTYCYLKNVKKMALSKEGIDEKFELKLCSFRLHEELKSLKFK